MDLTNIPLKELLKMSIWMKLTVWNHPDRQDQTDRALLWPATYD